MIYFIYISIAIRHSIRNENSYSAAIITEWLAYFLIYQKWWQEDLRVKSIWGRIFLFQKRKIKRDTIRGLKNIPSESLTGYNKEYSTGEYVPCANVSVVQSAIPFAKSLPHQTFSRSIIVILLFLSLCTETSPSWKTNTKTQDRGRTFIIGLYVTFIY